LALEYLQRHLENKAVPFLYLETMKYDYRLRPLFANPSFQEMAKEWSSDDPLR
jgi:hypothetical protein